MSESDGSIDETPVSIRATVGENVGHAAQKSSIHRDLVLIEKPGYTTHGQLDVGGKGRSRPIAVGPEASAAGCTAGTSARTPAASALKIGVRIISA